MSEPSRPDLRHAAAVDVRFAFRSRGRRFYRVLKGGEQIFFGLKGECERFARIHGEKVVAELGRTSPPRDRRVFAKAFRIHPRRAASA